MTTPTEAEILDAHNRAEIAHSLYLAADAICRMRADEVRGLRDRGVTVPPHVNDAYLTAYDACDTRRVEWEAARDRVELLNLAAQVGAA